MGEISSNTSIAKSYATNISNNTAINTNCPPPKKGVTNLAVNDNNSNAYLSALRGANELGSCIKNLGNGINSIAAAFEQADKKIADGIKK